MDLDPDVFWSLTLREFWLKHDAFIRAENRQKAEWIRHALRTVAYKGNAKTQMEQQADALTRYPLKPWTLPPGMTVAQMQGILSRPRMIRNEDDG